MLVPRLLSALRRLSSRCPRFRHTVVIPYEVRPRLEVLSTEQHLYPSLQTGSKERKVGGTIPLLLETRVIVSCAAFFPSSMWLSKSQ